MTTNPRPMAEARRRKPRRAVAPPTAVRQPEPGESATPDADWNDWLTSREPDAAAPHDAREKWFLDERPPHW